MTHLLDVNALLALVHQSHPHHQRVRLWLAGLQKTARQTLATCAITELGFLRVSVQAGLLPDVFAARSALAAFKASKGSDFVFLPDGLGADRLPAYVSKPAQITDGHLLQLAGVNRVQFVTLDSGIAGAVLIP
ncbi:MAG: TA system VapC family ribonuclease toxin [Opitutaceae bacterium]